MDKVSKLESKSLSVAEQFIQEGIELGMKKGEEKGIQKGLIKGKKEGRIEGKKEGRIEGKVEIIQQMLSLEKFSLSEIAQFTNTSLAFVKQVQKEMKQL